MKEIEVLRKFKDKDSNNIFEVGDVLEVDPSRFEEMENNQKALGKKYFKDVTKEPEKVSEDKPKRRGRKPKAKEEVSEEVAD